MNQPTSDAPADLLADIQAQLMTDDERAAYHAQIKQDAYMRWLAFYYLGRREHSAQELRDKLLAKGCDAVRVEALLVEFAAEGYQSDTRMTAALIAAGVRKGHGRTRIWHDIKRHGLTTLHSARDIDDWMSKHAEFFAANDNATPRRPLNLQRTKFFAANDNATISPTDGQDDTPPTAADTAASDAANVDWLTLAVETRVKKFGASIPTTPKEKARQLRFLQYRGFDTSVCFDALQHDLDSLAAR